MGVLSLKLLIALINFHVIKHKHAVLGWILSSGVGWLVDVNVRSFRLYRTPCFGCILLHKGITIWG